MLKPGKQWVLISRPPRKEGYRGYGLALTEDRQPVKGQVLAIGPLDKDEVSLCNVGDVVIYNEKDSVVIYDNLLVKTYNILAVE